MTRNVPLTSHFFNDLGDRETLPVRIGKSELKEIRAVGKIYGSGAAEVLKTSGKMQPPMNTDELR